MTGPDHTPGGPEYAPEPILIAGEVTLKSPDPMVTREQTADFGSYNVFTAAVPAAQPIRIMPEDPHRTAGYILVSGAGPVYIGTEAQMNQTYQAAIGGIGGSLVGGVIPAGILVPVGHRQVVWMCGDGTHAATVTVIMERRKQ